MSGKILLFMPTYEMENGILAAWDESIKSFNELQAPDGYEITRIISIDNPYGREGRHKNTLHQYQQARKRVLDDGFDMLVTFEHDMIVPKDGLIKMLQKDAPVVYGVYMLRHKAHCVNAFFHVTKSANLQKSMTYRPGEYKAAIKRGWARVTGVGFGFTLIKRAILEEISFHPTDENYAPDWGFAVDATRADIKQIARFDVLCGHIDTDGTILWPHKEGYKSMTKVKILKQFVSGRLYTPGQIADIDDEKIDDFYRAGYIEIMENKAPAVKIANKPKRTSRAKTVKAVKDNGSN